MRVLIDLEKGHRSSYEPSTLAAIEATLGWKEGSCDRIVKGGVPSRIADPELSRLIHLWPRLSRDARMLLAHLAESVARR